jgi:hypothetical protein
MGIVNHMPTSSDEVLIRSFLIEILVPNVTQEFKEGLGGGVLGTRELTFKATAADFQSPLFAMALLDAEKALLKEIVATRISEINTAPTNVIRIFNG